MRCGGGGRVEKLQEEAGKDDGVPNWAKMGWKGEFGYELELGVLMAATVEVWAGWVSMGVEASPHK